MPEVKNNFTGAKMNKDLSPRLISNNDYIDARNASVINSDGGETGLIENVQGNRLLTSFNLEGFNLEIIGLYIDTTANRLFAFITDWNDSSPSELDNFASSGSHHYICMYDVSSSQGYTLVSGSFLNFSKTHRMLGINLLENLLFFTDNRNQPRKINVNAAINNPEYYTREEHISVAKYYPWQPPSLVRNKEDGSLLVNSSMRISTNVDSVDNGVYVGIPATSVSPSGGINSTFTVSCLGGKVISVEVSNAGESYNAGDLITISGISGQVGDLIILVRDENLAKDSTMKDVASKNLPKTQLVTVSGTPTSTSFTASEPVNNKWTGALITATNALGGEIINVSDNILVTSTSGTTVNHTSTTQLSATDIVTIGANPNYDVLFEGDSEYLSDKFVRFSYRFKYDDGEYSLIAPFSQIAFVPKQDGYFLDGSSLPTNVNDETTESDENKAIKSTIISFFENKINSVQLMIDMPEGVSSVSDLPNELKVEAIEILYKESDETSIKVIDTITKNSILSNGDKKYAYTYNSQSPIRVLPQDETSRASDKVPIRAKAQEVAGNRIIYANYLVRTARPTDLDYTSTVSEKYKLGQLNSVSELEYPNHTLKQNRSYKVGIVLVDKFGRQSDVITSSNSTVYNPYKTSLSSFFTNEDVYRGDSLKIVFESGIPSQITTPGYAGLYSETNPNGWYTYKVVVQQKEQDYYNIFLPTILNNYPQYSNPTSQYITSKDTAFITLFSDNINKVPRDLKEVGPQQIQFSSSVNIFGRVWNNEFSSTKSTNKQYDPNTIPDKVVVIGTRDDIGLNAKINGDPYDESPFFGIPKAPILIPGAEEANFGSNPYIGKVSTQKEIGAIGGDSLVNGSEVTHESVRLNVYETEPFKSNLDIFYETTTAGLISDLNLDVELSASGSIPFSIDNWTFNLNENYLPGAFVSTESFDIVNVQGQIISSIPGTDVSVTVIRVYNAFDQDITSLNLFEVEKQSDSRFKLKTSTDAYFAFTNQSAIKDIYTITLRVINIEGGVAYQNDILVNSSSNALLNSPILEKSSLEKKYIPNFTFTTNSLTGGYIDEQSDIVASSETPFLPLIDYKSMPAPSFPKLPTQTSRWVDIKEFDFENGSKWSDFKYEGVEIEISDIKIYWHNPPWNTSFLNRLFYDANEVGFDPLNPGSSVTVPVVDYSDKIRIVKIIESGEVKYKLQYSEKLRPYNGGQSQYSNLYIEPSFQNPIYISTFYVYIKVNDANGSAGSLGVSESEISTDVTNNFVFKFNLTD